MIINNSMYLNYLNTLQNPSNDINAADNDDDSTSAANSSENTPVTLPANMDSVDISSTTEVEAEVIEKPKFNWKYNTTDDGYLPEFKLGDWENTSDILFGSSTMTVEERSYAVYLPEKLQE